MVSPVCSMNCSQPASWGMTMRGIPRSFAHAEIHMSAMFGCLKRSGLTGIDRCQQSEDVAMTWTECAPTTSPPLW